MSKKNKVLKSASTEVIAGSGHFDALAAVLSPEPGRDVVSAMSAYLQKIPGFAVLEQVAGIEEEKAELEKEATRLLSQAGTDAITLNDIVSRSSILQGRVMQYRASAKSKTLDEGDIASQRSLLMGKFSKWLEEAADFALSNDSVASNMAAELHALVTEGNRLEASNRTATTRAYELRQRVAELETEAQSLLASVSI